MILTAVIAIIILIALNSFLVGVEFTAAAYFRMHLDELPETGTRAGKITRIWLENPQKRDEMIRTAQLGITLTSLGVGIAGLQFFTLLLQPSLSTLQLPERWGFLQSVLPTLPLICTILIVGIINVVLGEQVPKIIALNALERFAVFAVPIMRILCAVLGWLAALTAKLTNLVIQMLGFKPVESSASMYSLEEIKQMVSNPEMAGEIQESEREMLAAVIDFGDLLVRKLSLPRTEIVAVEAETPIDEVLRLAIDKGLTKIPVYEEDMDQVIGIVHLRDMVILLQDGQAQEHSARELAREALYVPETISVYDLMRQFRDERKHIAIVLDEFGGTAGLITLEDLLEEIVGEVQNPFEAETPLIQVMPDSSALIDGKALIDEVNEFFGLNLIDDDYDTMGGYVLGKLGRIPKEGDVAYDWEQGVHLTVEKMDRLRIAQITLKRF